MYELKAQMYFSAAHHLLNYNGKCENMHELPEFKGISPSSEVLAKFIYEKMKERIPLTSKVSVWETSTSCASYF